MVYISEGALLQAAATLVAGMKDSQQMRSLDDRAQETVRLAMVMMEQWQAAQDLPAQTERLPRGAEPLGMGLAF